MKKGLNLKKIISRYIGLLLVLGLVVWISYFACFAIVALFFGDYNEAQEMFDNYSIIRRAMFIAESGFLMLFFGKAIEEILRLYFFNKDKKIDR